MIKTQSLPIMRIRRWLRIFAIISTLLYIVPAYAGGVADILLHSKADVSGQFIYLSEIASIQSDDPEKAHKLSRIRIESSPKPGRTLLVHPGKVERRLRRYGLDESQYRIASAGPVKVQRRFTKVEAEKIRQAVNAFIKDNAPWDSGQIRVRPIRFNQPVVVPAGPISLSVSAPKHTDWIGAIPFLVQIKVGGERAKKVTVPVNIEVWSEVAVVARPLGRFQPISMDYIRMEKMDLARVPADAVMDPEQILGRRTNRKIAANAILRSAQIELPPVVRRGDVVRVIAESPLMKIAVKGIIKQDGGLGERVKVINMRSKKTIYAQVLDPQTVKVEF